LTVLLSDLFTRQHSEWGIDSTRVPEIPQRNNTYWC